MVEGRERLCGRASEDLAEYLRQIRRVPLVEPEEERELARRWREDRCEAARERLVCANLRLVVYAAKRYAGIGLPLPDLIEAGNVGLLHAVDRFDPSVGARLATYALWWIRRAIASALTEHSSMVRLPEAQRRIRQVCREAMQRLNAESGGKATAEEISQSTGLTAKMVKTAQAAPVLTHVGSEDGADLLGEMHDARAASPEEGLIRGEMSRQLRRCVRSLPSQESHIVRLRFGLDGRSAMAIRQIAREIGLPESRVRTLLKAALGRLAFMMRDDAGGERTRTGSRAGLLAG